MSHITKQIRTAAHACTPMPDLERINYFYGQQLGVAEFQAEQNYFLEKLRLYNRCFHGYGIVCGLEVNPEPTEEDCDSDNDYRRREIKDEIEDIEKDIGMLHMNLEPPRNPDKIEKEEKQLEAKKEALQRRLDQLPDCYPEDKHVPAEVCVSCGWALDCEGREIVVRQAQQINMWSLLSAEQLHYVKKARDAGDTDILLELSVCYCEQPTYPSRPVVTDTCAAVSKCVYGRTREGFKFQVSLTPSEPDQRCSNCCEECEHECIVLAYIHWNPNRPILMEDIDWTPRRSVSTYQPTVIAGVSWMHGVTYSSDHAKVVLGTESSNHARTDGIEVVFSNQVYAETLHPGVVDLWRIQGGSGLSGVISRVEGSYVNKPDTGLINSFQYRDDSGETLNRGDQLLLTIRGNFILDECCQPIDGEHVGGMIPLLEGYEENIIDDDSVPSVPHCAQVRRQPWTSGNGRPGATFESWFFIN